MKWLVLIGDCGPSVEIQADGLRFDYGALVFWKRVQATFAGPHGPIVAADCFDEVVIRAFPAGRWYGVVEEK